MSVKHVLSVVIGGLLLCVASTGWTDVPAPPVNQALGMLDVLIGDMTEADCRACHDSGVPDRHHLLTDTPIPPGSLVPNPDVDGNGTPDTIYTCFSCHDESFSPVRDCVTCHTASAHHKTPAAASGDCVSCHGDIVDNIGDGHYIPTYAPSLVTPSVNRGYGLPLNSRRNGAGACNYCHDDDGLDSPIIRNSSDLHHATSDAWDGSLDCAVCHDIRDPLNIRVCEGCHGPDSLHNIQADSPAPGNIGMIVVGGEDAGYGHVGRDVAPGDSDCWGCHGFESASSPVFGPIIPTLYHADVSSILAGIDTVVTLTGASFINTMGTTLYESDVALTATDGSSVTLIPDIILDEGQLVVTIPGNTLAGNYNVQAVKDEFASNPVVISVVPRVAISRAVASRGLTMIYGSGFGSYAPNSGVTVTGTYKSIEGRRVRIKTMEGTVNSWTDSRIVVRFDEVPRTATVHSLFGEDTYIIVPE